MAKYKTTTQPATFVLHKLVLGAPGYWAPDYIGTGPLILDTAQWIAGGRRSDNVIFNWRGEQSFNLAVLRVTAISPGVPFAINDLAAIFPTFHPKLTPNPASYQSDLISIFDIDPWKFPFVNGGYAVAIRVVAVDDYGNPLPTTGTTPPPPPPPPPPGSDPNLPAGNTGTQGQPPYIYVQEPVRPTIDPTLLAFLSQSSMAQAARDQAREDRQARLDALDVQAAQERERRIFEAEREERRLQLLAEQERARSMPYAPSVPRSRGFYPEPDEPPRRRRRYRDEPIDEPEDDDLL